MKIHEQNKAMKEALAKIEEGIRQLRLYLSTSPKFQGTDNGERKDWISTGEAINLLASVNDIFMKLDDEGIDYKGVEHASF